MCIWLTFTSSLISLVCSFFRVLWTGRTVQRVPNVCDRIEFLSFFLSFLRFLFCPERRDGIYQFGDTNCWAPRAKHHVYLDQYAEASHRSALVLITSSRVIIAIYHSPASITCLLSLAVRMLSEQASFRSTSIKVETRERTYPAGTFDRITNGRR